MDLADIPPNDTIIWPSHTKTHPAVRLFIHSVILWCCKTAIWYQPFSTNDRKQLREVETAIGRKLWNHWNIPLRGAEASNHWHTLWRKVSWVSQLGHNKLGYRDGEAATLTLSSGWVMWGVSDTLSPFWLHIKLYFCWSPTVGKRLIQTTKQCCLVKIVHLQNINFSRAKKNCPTAHFSDYIWFNKQKSFLNP